jgi:hypothetical protein
VSPYTRISDGLYDSSLWSDGSYEGCATVKLWLAILAEARRAQGHFGRLTPAKAARIAAIPLDMAKVAIDRLTGPDGDDSSGIAEGRRLLPDPDGGPNDYTVTNWREYGRRFEAEAHAARQRRYREKQKASKSADSDAPVTPPSPSDGAVMQEEKKRSREVKPSCPSASPRTKKIFSEDSAPYRLAVLHRDLIRRDSPKFKEPNLRNWALDYDRAIRLDDRTSEELEIVLRWALADSFWSSNILSAASLRKQFDQLQRKMSERGAMKPCASSARDEQGLPGPIL